MIQIADGKPQALSDTIRGMGSTSTGMRSSIEEGLDHSADEYSDMREALVGVPGCLHWANLRTPLSQTYGQ
jgi:hypothetical protein